MPPTPLQCMGHKWKEEGKERAGETPKDGGWDGMGRIEEEERDMNTGGGTLWITGRQEARTIPSDPR